MKEHLQFYGTILTIIAGFVTLLVSLWFKWIGDKRAERKVKEAEFFASLINYIDYLLTVSYYPDTYVKKITGEILPKLEQLKSRLVQHQCILAAYSLGTFKASKDLVSEVIKIDGELTDIIMNDTFVQKDIQDLNKRAFASIKRSQKLIETIGSNYS